MRTVQKLRLSSFLVALVFSLVYLFCYIIPTEYTPKLVKTSETQNISDCQCSRKWMYLPTRDVNGMARFNKTGGVFKRLSSSCSDEGTHYRTDQNVITFSLFYSQDFTKENKNFCSKKSPLNLQLGLLQNLLMMRKYYPGYSIRVYTSVPLKFGGPFCQLVCENEDIFWCDIRKTPDYGDLSGMDFRTWRFLTLGDPTVNIFHSRDLDSLISHREAAAVQDWLSNSEKAIMLMRDFKGYHNEEMLGGMWGADNRRLSNGQGNKLRKNLISKSQKFGSNGYGFDMGILKTVIFYPMVKYILAYDSYHCQEWKDFTEVRGFPVRQRKPGTDFVGNYVKFCGNDTGPEIWKVNECPLKCRPLYGLDWIYC